MLAIAHGRTKLLARPAALCVLAVPLAVTPLGAQERQATLEGSFLRGAAGLAWPVADRLTGGIEIGFGFPSGDQTLRPEEGRRGDPDCEEYLHVAVFARLTASPNLEVDAGLRGAVADLWPCCSATTHFSADDASALTPVLQRRILRRFQRRGLLEEHTVDDMLTWQGTGGFSLDASVRIHGADRAGRERLLRYCARPPFALHRLRTEREPGGRSDDAGVRRVLYQPARPTPDGRTLLALSPLEFLGTLSRLIPPPTGAILRHLELPAAPPRLSPARGPPQPAFDLDADPGTPVQDPAPTDDCDQTPAFDPAEPEPVPELDKCHASWPVSSSLAIVAGRCAIRRYGTSWGGPSRGPHPCRGGSCPGVGTACVDTGRFHRLVRRAGCCPTASPGTV